MQYVKFPMSTLRITQGYGLEVDGVSTSVSGGTYSHTGSYALDLGGADTGADYLYAPCDVTVKRIYTSSGTNTTWFQSNEEVMCADGKVRQLVFMLCHANDSTISELGIAVGKTFSQGEKFYKEGTGGGVATHCHLEVGLAPFSGTGWYKSSYVDDRGQSVWIINNKLIPSDIFYLTSETNVVNDLGYNWRYLDEYIEYTTPMGIRILTGTGKNVEYFNTPDVNDIAGDHLPEGSEYTVLGHTTVADASGFTYVKFIYDDGNEYWMAILDDRVELFEKESSSSSGTDEDVSPSDSYIEFSASTGVRVLVGTGINVQYFNTPDVNDVAGNYLPEGSEYIALGQTTAADDNGFTYVKFVYSDNNEYWMAILDDRIELFKGSGIAFTENGIDVSDYQGVIDWQKVAAAGKKFAIIKAVGTNSNGTYISTYWESNYQGCKDNGIKVGAYLYTYAYDIAGAEDELTYLLQALKGKTFNYPVFIDVEDKLLYQNCSVEVLTNTVKYLCQRLEEEGYYPAIYTYTYFANTYLNMSELSDYDLWIADWTGSVTYQGDYTMWQYTSSGSVDGIEGNVDLDISYKDYSSIIKNDEGGNKMATQTLKMTIQFRRDTTANWELYKSVVPAAGEPCFDLDLGTLKIGDGVKTYEQLDVIGGSGGVAVSADGKSIVLSDSIFKLAGFDAADPGAQPRKNADGELEWVVPTGATNEELQAAVAGLQSDVKSLQDIVTPTDEGTTPLLDRVVALENAMTGSGDGSVDQKISDEVTTQINEWASQITDDNDTIDTFKELVDYVATHAPEAADMATDIAALQTAVAGKVDAEEGKSLVSDTLIAKLEAIEDGAQANKIEEIKVGDTLLEIVDKTVVIPVATTDALGVVKGSDEVTVAADGSLGIKQISLSKLVQDDDTELVLDGGAAN